MFKKLESFMLIIPFMASLILSSTAYGGMDDVKETFETGTNIAIVSTPGKHLTFDPRTGSQRFGMSSRPSFPQNETAPLPATFSQPGDLAAEQIKTQLPDLALRVVDPGTLPQTKFLSISSPDWKSTDYDAFVDLTTLVKYSAFPAINNKFIYSLEADVLLFIKKKNKKGKFKIVRPNMMGSYKLARVNEKISFNGSTTTSVKTLEQIMEAMPPETILENLKSQIPGNVEKFVAEVKAAK